MKYLLIAAIVLNSCTSVVEVAAPPRIERTESLTLAQKCRSLLRDKDPATWDPVTETYPANIEWQTCMGVEPK